MAATNNTTNAQPFMFRLMVTGRISQVNYMLRVFTNHITEH